MRHFLKFIPAAQRAEAAKQYAEGNDAPVAANRAPAPKPPTRGERPSRATVSAPAARHPAARETDYNDVHRPAYKPAPRPAKPRPDKPQPNVATDVVGIKARLEEAAATESTGAFLSSLDNSAIALADSGLFNADIDEDADADAPSDAGFNPYDRG